MGGDQYSPCCATSTVLLSLSSLRNAVKVVSFTPTEIKQEKSISGLTQIQTIIYLTYKMTSKAAAFLLTRS